MANLSGRPGVSQIMEAGGGGLGFLSQAYPHRDLCDWQLVGFLGAQQEPDATPLFSAEARCGSVFESCFTTMGSNSGMRSPPVLLRRCRPMSPYILRMDPHIGRLEC